MPYKDLQAKRDYQRIWIANRRADYLKDKSCINCGSTEFLEIDHIEPDEKISHKVFSWSEARRAAELAKCQILCNMCHMEKTLSERASI